MEQIKCINCGTISEITPKNRCINCNYPLFPKDKVTGGGGTDPYPAQSGEATEPAATTAVTEGMIPPIPSDEPVKEIKHHENTVADKADVDVKAGWLVVHMPDRDTLTYDLYLGKNVVGRPTSNNDVDIPIEDDDFVSRKHMTIVVEKENEDLTCTLYDDGRESGGRPSTNGTFINGSEQRVGPTDAVVLKNNDSIQVGETVVIFRSIYEDTEVVEAATAVMDMDFIKAIAIK